MTDKKTILTKQHKTDLENELKKLKNIKRKEVAGKIQEALSLGDLSENTEYHAAKEEQAEIEMRIAQLKKILHNTEVIDADKIATDYIDFGCRVKILDIAAGETNTYMLVGSTEADPSNGKISNESPLGAALVGKKAGESVEIDTPKGPRTYHIEAIES